MISKLKRFIKNTRKAKAEGYETSTGDIFYLDEVVLIPAGTPIIRSSDGYRALRSFDTKAYIKYFGNNGYFTVEPTWSEMNYKVHSNYLVKLNRERNYNKNLMEFLLS